MRSVMSYGIMIVCILAIVTAGWFFFARPVSAPHSGDEIVTVRIGEHAWRAKIVRTNADRERGLGGRETLCVDCAMLFAFEQPDRYGFWMKDMRFALDILWINDNRIVHFEKNIAPDDARIFRPGEEADRVLEIPAGQADAFGLQKGMEVEEIR